MDKKLESIRTQLDEIDSELCELLNRRFNYMKDVAAAKINDNLPITNKFREEQIIEKIQKNEALSYSDSIGNIYRAIMEESKRIQGSIIYGKKNIWLIGMPGSGKSTVGRAVAEYMCKSFYDSDEVFTQLIGMTPENCIATMGEPFFRDAETKVLGVLAKKTNAVIACGGGVVVRENNRDIIKDDSYVIYIKRDIERLALNGRPLSVQFGLDDLYIKRHKAYETWSDFSVNNDILDNCIKSICREIKNRMTVLPD